jgi:dihydrofolate reductase
MIGMIAAIDLSGLIAYQDRIPWVGHFKADLIRFRQVTTESIIVMGRKTYDSIGKPLPKRTNCVVTKHSAQIKNVVSELEIYEDLFELLQSLKETAEKPIWIIGGAEIYQQALQSNLVDKIDLTIINSYWQPSDNAFDVSKAIYFPTIPWSYTVTEEFVNEQDKALLHRVYQKSIW